MKQKMNRNLQESYRLAQLILKELTGENTEEESRKLQEWIDESPANRRQYEQWMQRLQVDVASEEPADAQQAWRQFEKRVRPRKRNLFMRPAAWAAYAAVLVIAFLLGNRLLFNQQAEVTAQTEQSIVPGTAKAELVTESGETILITPQQQVNLSQTSIEEEVDNKDGILHYDNLPVKLTAQPAANIYHKLSAPKGGEYRIVLSDGTFVHLNSDSELRYPVVFTDADSIRRIYIKGEAYFQVAHNEQKPFEVHTAHGVIRVLGTEFNVHDYDDEPQALITLAEGSVAYRADGKEYLLSPNEQLSFDKMSGRIRIYATDAKAYTSWTDGIFEFNGMPLELIMKQLSRWYDVDYEFKVPALKYDKFTGITYRNATLKGLLRMIEKTTSIHFEVKDRTIIISN